MVVFVLLFRESKNKVLRKAVGSFLIVTGLFIFNPIPGIDDLAVYSVFSGFMGWEFSLNGVKQNFLPYTFITGAVGLTVAYAGLLISGLNLNYLKNKIKRMFR